MAVFGRLHVRLISKSNRFVREAAVCLCRLCRQKQTYVPTGRVRNNYVVYLLVLDAGEIIKDYESITLSHNCDASLGTRANRLRLAERATGDCLTIAEYNLTWF
jgi:hypothetical protein